MKAQINRKHIGIKNIKHLEAVLNFKVEAMEQLIADREKFYYIKPEIKKDKKGNIKYDEAGNIKYRYLNPSKGELKLLQKRINYRILALIPLPTYVQGGVKGYTNITNARAHLGKLFKFKTDMKSYFPSISHERVYTMYLRNGFSAKIATLLTHLTTNNYQVPQGAPTSTAIANLIFVPNDLLIASFCKKHQLTYTRFVDDMVFSSAVDFQQHCNTLINFIVKDGFSVSADKTVYKIGKLDITGVEIGQNMAQPTKGLKELIADPTVSVKKTKGRQLYIKNLLASNRRHLKTTPNKITIDEFKHPIDPNQSENSPF